MPIPTYTPGYPPDGSSLGQTKSTIRNNLDGTFQTLAIDHIDNNGSPGAKPAGYHKIIHEVTQTSVSTVSGYNQIFSGVPGTLVVNSVTTPAIPNNGDTQLYSLSSSGVLSQLTGKSASSNGYVWVGGILLQWGSATFSGTNTTVAVSFPVTFPNAVASVQLTRLGGNTSSNPEDIFIASGPSTSSFTARRMSASPSSGLNFYWMAVGY